MLMPNWSMHGLPARSKKAPAETSNTVAIPSPPPVPPIANAFTRCSSLKVTLKYNPPLPSALSSVVTNASGAFVHSPPT